MGRVGAKARTRLDRRKALLNLLREIRKEAGLRQVEMAQRLGKPQSFVSKYESGERRLDLLDIQEVCNAAGICIRDFVLRFEQAGQAVSPSDKAKATRAR